MRTEQAAQNQDYHAFVNRVYKHNKRKNRWTLGKIKTWNNIAKTDFSIGHNLIPIEYIIMIDEINQITDGTSKQAKSSKLNEHGIPPQKRLFIKNSSLS